jgi:hypothetical protein
MAAKRSRMPAGRTVVHRTTPAIRPAVPTRSTPASHRNGRGIASCRLIERRHRHGLGSRHRRESDADREQRSSKYPHWHSFLLVRGEITCDQITYATSPVTVVPPVAVVPPATVMVPVAMPVPVPVAVMPVHLFRLDAIDVVLRHDSRFSVSAPRHSLQLSRYWRQRCSLRACGQHDCAACHKSNREF